MELKKFVFAAMLAAISVVLNAFFKTVIAISTIGTAFYAIPIIIACIFLDLKHSVLVALVSDVVGVLISPLPFMFMFTFGTLTWGIIPKLLKINGGSMKRLILTIFITHLFATTINSFAIYYHVTNSFAAMLVDLPLRLILIIPNTLILAFIVEAVSEAINLKDSFLTNSKE